MDNITLNFKTIHNNDIIIKCEMSDTINQILDILHKIYVLMSDAHYGKTIVYYSRELGKILNDNDINNKINDLKLTNNSVIRLQFKSDLPKFNLINNMHRNIRINIKTLTNKNWKIKINDKTIVSDLKHLLVPHTNVHTDNMRLLHNGIELLNDNIITSNYNIKEEDVIHLIFKLKGGYSYDVNRILYNELSNNMISNTDNNKHISSPKNPNFKLMLQCRINNGLLVNREII